MTRSKCIHIIGHGFECDMSYVEWAMFEIQDEKIALTIAKTMLDNQDGKFGYNGEEEPEYFRMFSINDRHELVKQLSLARREPA